MRARYVEIVLDQGRGVVGALLFGTPFVYTMETWWIGWQLPASYLLAYTFGGLTIILVLVRHVGFKQAETRRTPAIRELAADVAELLMQSLAATYAILLLFGIIDTGTSLNTFARLGFIQLVPMGLGAAIANHLLRATEEENGKEAPFPKDLGISALGALFFALPIAPSGEIELMAAHAGWWRLALVVLASVLVTHLTLHEIELRGQKGRLRGMTHVEQWGATCLAYTIALVVAFLLLLAFGALTHQPPGVWIALSIVLAFPATLGGSAARVVL